MLSNSFAQPPRSLPLLLLLLLLVLEQQLLPANAANMPAHLKQQQQHPSTQHPILHPQQQQQLLHQQQQQQAQYVHEKDSIAEVLQNDHHLGDDDLSDPYQILNELKHESRLPTPPPPGFPWHLYQQSSAAHPFEGMMHTPKFLPFFGFPQPIFIPYPLYIAPDMFYPAAASFSGANNDGVVEESMSRAANARRPSSTAAGARNSPIYYVRLPPPPTPYMFLPGLGFGAHSPAAAGGFSSIMPYSSSPLASIPAFSSIFNLPMNFLANGKPSSIYQIGGSPNDLGQNAGAALQFAAGLGSYGARPPPPNPYRPASPSSSSSSSTGGFLSQSPYGPPPPPHQDSKMTALKRPFVFNGRPEEIYILPNNFNPLYQDSGLAGYY